MIIKGIGIDLGTTNSLISYVGEDNKAHIILDKNLQKITPSVFSVDEKNNIYIGNLAISRENKNLINTIRSIKRYMGTNEKKNIFNKQYSPEEISSYILKHMKNYAELFLNQSVKDCVITVPAYFNSDQRQSTKTAGELAGLNVLRVISEPTAASLAYGLGQNKNEKIIVFDLGGGTFDISVLEITEQNVFRVLATTGDSRLGGDDFDNEITSFILNKMNISAEEHSLNLFKTAIKPIAEEAKIVLSSFDFIKKQKVIYLENTSYKIDFTITKKDFESLIEKYLIKMKNCLSMVIRDAGLTYKDIDKIILVGGSTKIPLIREKIKEWTGISPSHDVNPDEAVALGASIQCSLLNNKDNQATLLDVNPLSLGIEISNGMMVKMINRNTTIPTISKEIFSTLEDNQDRVVIRVYQGERPRAKDNIFLGEFTLEDIEPLMKGEPQIEVTFEIDSNGILSIIAKDLLTNKYKFVSIKGNSSLSKDEIDKIINESNIYKEQDDMLLNRYQLLTQLDEFKIQLERALRNDNKILDKELSKKITSLLKIIGKIKSEDTDEFLLNIINEASELMPQISEKLQKKAQKLMEGI